MNLSFLLVRLKLVTLMPIFLALVKQMRTLNQNVVVQLNLVLVTQIMNHNLVHLIVLSVGCRIRVYEVIASPKKPLNIGFTKNINHQLAKFILAGYHPFLTVEEPEFKKLMALVIPNYTLPSRKTLSNSSIN